MQPNLEIIRGDDDALEVEFEVEGAPLDLTGSTVFFTIKENIDDTDADALLKAQQSTHIDPTNGITVIPLGHAETLALDPGVYFYDIQSVASDGSVTSMPYRKIKVLPDITTRTS